MNYYNEHDPKAAAWLRELIAAGLIPPGDVDTRSIVDVQPDDVCGYMQCHWFAGIGGWSEALRLAGWPSELPVWTGSCPCQPYSVAGKQEGNADARDLWPQFARLIRECKPPTVFGEQVEGAVRHGWLDRVCGDLEAEGYAVGAHVLGAHSVGAPHIRQRLYWVADGERGRCREAGIPGCMDGIQGQPQDLPMQASQRGPHGGLADAASVGHQRKSQQRPSSLQPEVVGSERVRVATSTHGASLGRVADAVQPGQRGGDERGSGTSWEQMAEQENRQDLANESGDGRENVGAWSNVDIIQCRDGKARRVESGVFPLAHGVPSGLVPSGDPSEQEVQASAEARVMRLRGAGNAIVPQVAAEFVRAFMDTES